VSAAEIIEGATRGSPLAEVVGARPLTAAAISARILDARVSRLERERRMDPISALPVLLFVLRLQREGVRVRQALWSAAAAGGVGP